MGIKKYIGFSLLLIIAVGFYVYSIESAEYKIEMFDFSLLLPVAIWIIVPLVVLFIFTVFHLLFYGSLHYCKNRGYSKDELTIIETIKANLLQKQDIKKFKTSAYKNLAGILNQLNIDIKDSSFTSSNESLNTVVSQIKDIQAGKYVNEKSIKLDKDSALAKQNLINKMKEQPDYALDVLKKSDNFSPEIVRVAFLDVLENKSMTTVKKVYTNVTLDRELALKLFVKDIENSEFGFSKEEIIKITKSLNYTSQEYLILARLYKEALSPDKLLELFEAIFEQNEEATNAYFYILCELEMIDKVRELLSGYNEDELVAFRALLDLKDTGKHYNLDDLSL